MEVSSVSLPDRCLDAMFGSCVKSMYNLNSVQNKTPFLIDRAVVYSLCISLFALSGHLVGLIDRVQKAKAKGQIVREQKEIQFVICFCESCCRYCNETAVHRS